MDSASIIKAVAVLVTAIAPIIGMVLSYQLKRRLLDHKIGVKDASSKAISQYSDADTFRKLVFNCMVVYFIAGTMSQAIGVYDNFDGYGELFWEKNVCWFVGNATVLFMLCFHALSSKKI